jgi:hypothetical protein
VRRWVAPTTATITIAGVLKHEPSPGAGMRGFIVSSRHGLLKQTKAHASESPMTAEGITVEAGDTIDFVVDIGDDLNSDQFLWEPVITAEEKQWRAAADFIAPPPAPVLLQPWEQYAHVLLLANESAFVD